MFNPPSFEHDLGTHACVLNRDVPIVHSDFRGYEIRINVRCVEAHETIQTMIANSTCGWVKLHT